MKSEISFYQTDESIARSLAPLLLKILEDKKKALVFCTNPARLKEVDDSLWTYGRSKFIPHATISEAESTLKKFSVERQPVLLSDREENSNQADYLIFLDEPSESFVGKFSRVFYLYEPHEANRAKVLEARFNPKNSYRKEAGKWVKA